MSGPDTIPSALPERFDALLAEVRDCSARLDAQSDHLRALLMGLHGLTRHVERLVKLVEPK